MMTAARPAGAARIEGRMPETGGTYYDRQEVRARPTARRRSSTPCRADPPRPRQRPFFAELLAGIDPDAVASRAELARLPVVRKSELSELQAGTARSAGSTPRRSRARADLRLARADLRSRRVPGPTTGASPGAMYAAGFRTGDIVHNSFSYHLTPAGSMAESGAGRWACRSSRAAPARPSCSCGRSPTSAPPPMPARPPSC